MNEIQAVIEIAREARKERLSLAGYRRMLRALKALGITNLEDQKVLLTWMEYLSPGTGEPHVWLATKLKQGKREGIEP